MGIDFLLNMYYVDIKDKVIEIIELISFFSKDVNLRQWHSWVCYRNCKGKRMRDSKRK